MSSDNFELFDGEGIYASAHRQILDVSIQSSCKNCIKWSKADSECDAFTFDLKSGACTKLRGLHRRNHVFAVLTDPVVAADGQYIQKPLSLVTNQTEFPLSNEHHHIKFMDNQETACRMQTKSRHGSWHTLCLVRQQNQAVYRHIEKRQAAAHDHGDQARQAVDQQESTLRIRLFQFK